MIIVLPFKFSFVYDINFYWELFDYSVDFCFFFDILLIFNTAVYENDEQINWSRKSVALSYLKLWFWIDFFSILPIHIFFNSSEYLILVRVSRIPRLYKILKISKLLRSLKQVNKDETEKKLDIPNFFKQYPGLERVIMNILSIFLICHLFACAWHFIGWTDPSQNNWIWALNLRDESLWHRYLYSFYWIT